LAIGFRRLQLASPKQVDPKFPDQLYVEGFQDVAIATRADDLKAMRQLAQDGGGPEGDGGGPIDL
jgi:hypothetical protein